MSVTRRKLTPSCPETNPVRAKPRTVCIAAAAWAVESESIQATFMICDLSFLSPIISPCPSQPEHALEAR